MKLEITRGLLLVGALAVATAAAAAWHEPAPNVVQMSGGHEYCPTPSVLKAERPTRQEVQPNKDILLLMFGLSQGGSQPVALSLLVEKAPPWRGFFMGDEIVGGMGRIRTRPHAPPCRGAPGLP